ncbi:MAG: SIS domain-containing protein [Tissierellales bacterium]|nr:SIS domain-containing protein [Tissierellales bacterium]
MSEENNYIDHIIKLLNRIKESQNENIIEAANLIAKAFIEGNSIFVFGCSHAGILSEEMFYRTGGFALINPIFNPSLMLNTRPITLTSKVERLEGFGSIILDESPIKRGDVLILHSVSGRNPVIVDVALKAKENSISTIAITNLEYSQKVLSRHSSGKKLYEIADIVIDNCGEYEDAAIKLDGMEQKIGPTSTIAATAIGHSMIIEVSKILLNNDIIPPIYHSANIDGGDDFNKKIMDKYGDRIHYI